MEQVIHDFMKDDATIRRIVGEAQREPERRLTSHVSGETRTERRARERREAKAAKRQKVAA